MGKKLRQQRRGKGSNSFRKPPNYFKADVAFSSKPTEGRMQAEVVEFVDDPGHSAPLMRVVYEDSTTNMLFAPEGIKLGDRIQEGKLVDIGLGNILTLSSIPDGMTVYNVEVTPGDGGKLVRAAGRFATVVSHAEGIVNVRLPSKKTVALSPLCRAEIGAIAGGGADSQPLMKAGKSHHIMHAINGFWPRNRGVKMNPVDHPFGGKQHHKGASSMVSRNAPPGAKVGHIAASRVGRKKRS